MKILMLLENNYPGDLRVENEIRALERSGHMIRLISGTETMPELIRKSFIAHPWLPMYENWWRKRVRELIKGQEFDAIHIHDLPLARLGYETSRAKKIPFILDLHENYPALLRDATHTKKPLGRILHSDKAWRRFERDYILTADRIIVTCKESSFRIRGEYNKVAWIVQNTPDLLRIPNMEDKKPFRDGILKIFYAGAINKHRGLQTVIEAIRILYNKHDIIAWLTIAGEGSYKKELQRQASTLPRQPAIMVRFVGQQSFDTIFRMMREHHIGIIPHLRNENNDASSPHKLFQYMATGIPILASDCPSVARIVKNNGAGYVYEAGNARDLADWIRRIDENRDLLDIGDMGIRAVYNKYNWINDSQGLINLYNNGVSGL